MRRRAEGDGRSVILESATRALGHTVLAVALYLLLAGHNRPGGGFAAGLVAGAGIALVYAGGGVSALRRVVALSPWTFIGLGGLVAFATAVAPLLVGDAFLESGPLVLDLPVVGEVKAYSVLAFDIGVFLVVVGAELGLLETLGARPEEPLPGEEEPS